MKTRSRIWYFKDAQEHFREIVRRTMVEGPQTVRIYGKKQIVFKPVEQKDYKLRILKQKLG